MKKILKTIGFVSVLLVAYAAFQFLFTYIATFLVLLFAVLSGEVSTDALKLVGDQGLMGVASSVDGVYVWGMAIGLFLSTVAMLLFIHYIKGYRLSFSLFRSMSGESLFISTLLVFSSMFAMNIFVQWFNLEDVLSGQFDGLVHNVIGVITIALLAPFLEEVMFRGAIQGYMMRYFKPWVAIVFAALVFGVFHLNPIQILYATLIGIVFGWIYYRTGSLLSVIVGHVLNNTMATVQLLLYGGEDELKLAGELASPSMELAAEIFTFSFFALLSIYFAIRLNRMLPPVQQACKDDN